jgi:hypothetical protein
MRARSDLSMCALLCALLRFLFSPPFPLKCRRHMEVFNSADGRHLQRLPLPVGLCGGRAPSVPGQLDTVAGFEYLGGGLGLYGSAGLWVLRPAALTDQLKFLAARPSVTLSAPSPTASTPITSPMQSASGSVPTPIRTTDTLGDIPAAALPLSATTAAFSSSSCSSSSSSSTPISYASGMSIAADWARSWGQSAQRWHTLYSFKAATAMPSPHSPLPSPPAISSTSTTTAAAALDIRPAFGSDRPLLSLLPYCQSPALPLVCALRADASAGEQALRAINVNLVASPSVTPRPSLPHPNSTLGVWRMLRALEGYLHEAPFLAGTLEPIAGAPARRVQPVAPSFRVGGASMVTFGVEPVDDDVDDCDSEENADPDGDEGIVGGTASHRQASSVASGSGTGSTSRRPTVRGGAVGSSQALATGVGTITVGAAERDRIARAAWHRFTSLNICLLPVLHRYRLVLNILCRVRLMRGVGCAFNSSVSCLICARATACTHCSNNCKPRCCFHSQVPLCRPHCNRICPNCPF